MSFRNKHSVFRLCPIYWFDLNMSLLIFKNVDDKVPNRINRLRRLGYRLEYAMHRVIYYRFKLIQTRAKLIKNQ